MLIFSTTVKKQKKKLTLGCSMKAINRTVPVDLHGRPEVKHDEGEGHVAERQRLERPRHHLVQGTHLLGMLEVRSDMTSNLQRERHPL